MLSEIKVSRVTHILLHRFIGKMNSTRNSTVGSSVRCDVLSVCDAGLLVPIFHILLKMHLNGSINITILQLINFSTMWMGVMSGWRLIIKGIH